MIESMHPTNAMRTKNEPVKHKHNILSGTMASRGIVTRSHLYTEETFHALYHQERKRMERSGNPFIVTLIDVSRLEEKCTAAALPNTPATKKSADTATNVPALSHCIFLIEKCLFNITREHDSKGWCLTNKIIGLIFTEIKTIEKRILTDKILEGLRAVLAPDQMEQITLSSYRISGKKTATDNVEEFPDNLIAPRDGLWFATLPALQKRTVDILGATAAIILFLPLFIIIALLIKSTSKGPAFFCQERIGRNGKKFTMLKFRSMKVDNDPAIHQEYVKKLIKGTIEGEDGDDGEKIFKITNDPRITKVGRFLRKTSLDELPQFLNVFKGDMSLVGPRPALAYEVAEYDTWHCRRISAIPGITGFWQVEGRSRTTFNDMVRMDIRYIKQWSLFLDLKLIFKTPFSLLLAKGAF
jgi:lipopolysaccharide/colanic/teichoic acid biosynthesis glycosyltransferase